MRIGFGTTVWMRALMNGRMDGIGVYSKNLWQKQKSLGQAVRAYVFGVSSNLGEADTREPFPVHCIENRYTGQVIYSVLTGQPFRNTRKLSGEIDLFHATDHHIPRLRNIPVVATIMDAIPLVHPEWASARLRWAKNSGFRRAAHWARHVITISEFSKGDIVDAFGIVERDITVIPLGYDESFKRRHGQEKCLEILKRYGLKDDFFIFVGTFQPRKNIRRLIAAHGMLRKEIQDLHPLVLVGNYGWGDETLIDEIRQMEQRGQGRWLQGVPHDDLVALLQSAKAMVYPSLYEGFGLPILEGFAAGIPVISSNTTSIPEVAGNAAWLVDPLDTEEIAHAMLNVAENGKLASTLVQRGKKQLERFSWHACAQATVNVYQKML